MDFYYNGINSSLKVGDWVTQCNVGLWQIVGIYPQYATFDYTLSDNSVVKKGDYTENYILMKKAFTPKMKFRLDASSCVSGYCQKVNEETLREIEKYFETHPNDKRRFDEYEPVFPMSYYNVSYEVEDDVKLALIYDFAKNYQQNSLSIDQIFEQFESVLGHGSFKNNYAFVNDSNKIFKFAFEYVGWHYNDANNSHMCKQILIK